jgi:hypothetical protein
VACLVEPDQCINPSPVYSTVDGSVAERIVSKHNINEDFAGRVVTPSYVPGYNNHVITSAELVCRLLGSSMPAGLRVLARGAVDSTTIMLESPCMNLGKCDLGMDDNLHDGDLETDNSQGQRLGKKAKSKVAATIGVSEVGGSTNRTCRKPAVKAPAGVNTSKAVGFRADMLMILSAQGGDQLLQEPSVQQESTGTTVQEEFPSAEEGVQGAPRYQCDTMMQQEEEEVHSMEDGKLGATKNNLFYISKRLNEDYKSFLKANSEDFARGTLYELKCKLCPAVDLTTWDDFARHCKTAEAHPLEIFICRRCGDFFARYDSLQRHSKNQPPECLRVSPREAEDKCTETKRIHEEFKKNLKYRLETNEGNWRPFAQIIREKYPNSSKRGRRKQYRLQASKSRPS